MDGCGLVRTLRTWRLLAESDLLHEVLVVPEQPFVVHRAVLVRLRFVDALGAESVQPLLPECDRPLVLERPSATPTTPSEDELPFANTMREFDTGNCDRGARE